MEMHRVPLALSALQPKIFHDWRLRPGYSGALLVNTPHLFLYCGSAILFYSVPPVIFQVSLMLPWIHWRQGRMFFRLSPVSTAGILAILHLPNITTWIIMKRN